MVRELLSTLGRYAVSYLLASGLRFPGFGDSGLFKGTLHLMASLAAPYWDEWSRSLHMLGQPRWDTIRELLPEAPEAILDLGTGTGDAAIQLAQMFPHARITAVDFSGRMLVQARAKATAEGVAERITFQTGDAGLLPFGDAAFDLVISQNAPIPYVEEMVRVTKGGGVVAAGWAHGLYTVVAPHARRRFRIGGLKDVVVRPVGGGLIVVGEVP